MAWRPALKQWAGQCEAAANFEEKCGRGHGENSRVSENRRQQARPGAAASSAAQTGTWLPMPRSPAQTYSASPPAPAGAPGCRHDGVERRSPRTAGNRQPAPPRSPARRLQEPSRLFWSSCRLLDCRPIATARRAAQLPAPATSDTTFPAPDPVQNTPHNRAPQQRRTRQSGATPPFRLGYLSLGVYLMA